MITVAMRQQRVVIQLTFFTIFCSAYIFNSSLSYFSRTCVNDVYLFLSEY
jgi:hypothetical protein